MPKRHNNIIYKRFLKSKIIKVIPSSTTRIRPTIYIEDSKKAFSVDHAHIENTEVSSNYSSNILKIFLLVIICQTDWSFKIAIV